MSGAGGTSSRGAGGGRAEWRSILFVPGDRPDRFAKALAAGADAVCIDLEDAVAPARKAVAREAVRGFLVDGDRGWKPSGRPSSGAARGRLPVRVTIRLNALGSAEGRRDAAVLSPCPPPDALILPKVTTASDVRAAHRRFGEDVGLIPIVETTKGLANAAEIGEACAAVTALAFGGFDLAAELGADPTWEALLYGRSRVVHAAALNRLAAFDMPSRELRGNERLHDEAVRARRMGFTGKIAIHPAQIAAINGAFTPSSEEVAEARRIVAGDRAADGGAVALDGRMVDRPVVEAAHRTLRRAGLRR